MPKEPESTAFTSAFLSAFFAAACAAQASTAAIPVSTTRRKKLLLRNIVRAFPLENGSYFQRDLGNALAGGVHAKVCFHVSAAAAFVQLAKLVLILIQRTRGSCLGASPPQFTDFRIQKHHRVPGPADRCRVLLLRESPASQGRHRAARRRQLCQQFAQRPALGGAKGALARVTKNFGNAAPLPRLDAIVEVHKSPSQPGSKRLPHTGLTRAHVSDQDHGPCVTAAFENSLGVAAACFFTAPNALPAINSLKGHGFSRAVSRFNT